MKAIPLRTPSNKIYSEGDSANGFSPGGMFFDSHQKNGPFRRGAKRARSSG
jgi:hypothetical protein